jgi:hypothetical protein
VVSIDVWDSLSLANTAVGARVHGGRELQMYMRPRRHCQKPAPDSAVGARFTALTKIVAPGA